MPTQNQSAPQVVSQAGGPPAANGEHPLLRFEHVVVRFDNMTALNDVSFDLWPGETRIVLGAAGSGKSVLLKTAIGLQRADAGQVWLFGTEISRLEEVDLF